MATKTEGRESGRPAGQRRPDPQEKAGGQTRARGPQAGSKQTDRDPDERRRRIAEAAYYRAERRGFAAGYDEADWLDAENEIDGQQDEDRGAPDKRQGPASSRSAAKSAT